MSTKRFFQPFKDVVFICLGSLIFCFSINIFLLPLHVYSAGFVGISQLVRDGIWFVLGHRTSFDIAGIINFILNGTLLLFAYKKLSAYFVKMTIITLTFQTFFFAIIPIPSNLTVKDIFTTLIIGAFLGAVGTALIFKGHGSGGGIDIIGLYLTQINRSSVGKIYLLVNSFVYLICLIFYSFSTAVYSFICSVFLSFILDRLNEQALEICVLILTGNTEMEQQLVARFSRGVTYWKGYGAYTSEQKMVCISVITKDNLKEFLKFVKQVDPEAFVVVTNNINVHGNFSKNIA